jgi:hypothetical protein
MTTRIETEDVELLPCPFCGLHLREDGTEWHHEIADCPLADCVFDEQQIAEWNTRSATPIERLREENARRVCTVCKAVVSVYPEGMCCHCEEMPWPIESAALTPSADDDK